MQIALLGPIEVTRDGRPVEIRGTRLRSLLVPLALRAGRPVATQVLVEAVWGDEPPADAGNALQSLVSRLRSALGEPRAVRQVPGGYLLEVPEDAVDALCFERLAREPGRAREALDLWRGPLDPEVPAVRLEQLRLSALAARAADDLAAGTDVLAELQELVLEHPRHEGFAAQLMVALSRAGRQAEALAAYERIRALLADELGADPSSALQATHLEVLRAQHEPAPHNLRAPVTAFLGRQTELADVGRRLATHRLVTVVGTGGAGKTRLAEEAAGRLPAVDGVWFVELAPVTDPAAVPQTVLAAVGLRQTSLLDRRAAPREVVAALVGALAGKGTLLVLDNAEHVLDAVAALVDALLARCPDLRVLVTSREPLGMAGESLVPLAPLDVPAAGASPAEAVAHTSVALFAERAAAVRPGFAVDDTTVADVVEVVRRLDGLPLALELAAARLRSLPLTDVRRRLDDRFRLLTGGSRSALPRHRTLDAVVAWSWDLLTDEERRLAERASAFPAGLTADSAGAVVDPDLAPDLLAALADKSLLQLTEGSRYRMLETLREYGSARLAERGELADVRERHARWFAALVARAEPELRGAGQLVWLSLLQAEHDNVAAAVGTLVDLGDADAALALTLDLGWYWTVLGRHAECQQLLGSALGVDGGDPLDRLCARTVAALSALSLAEQLTSSQVTTGTVDGTGAADPRADLIALGRELASFDLSHRPAVAVLVPIVLWLAGDLERSQQVMDRWAGSSADPWLQAATRLLRARLAENTGDLDAARLDVAPAEAGFRSIGDRWGLASVLPLVALLRQYDGDLATALVLLEEAAGLAASLGSNDVDDQVFIAMRRTDVHMRLGQEDLARAVMREVDELGRASAGLESLGILEAFQAGALLSMGDPAAARRAQVRAEEALGRAALGSLGATHGVAIVRSSAARLALQHGDLPAALAQLEAAHAGARSSEDMPIAAIVGLVVAELAVAEGRLTDAAEVAGAAARLRGAEDPTDLAVVRVRSAVVRALGEQAHAAAFARGHRLDLQAALDRIDPALDRIDPALDRIDPALDRTDPAQARRP